ncbi:hypothetical protein [Desulfoluna spongiiphila]|uniref:hypothetical protein n=1 Tax=Desulfoluna spongiiphila TaxID=419481 RepID=UPI00125A3535|nr:hypothetical protein [Desulfoluna spongiiphila]VVS94673.1 hypothetical protein DBB_42450 [Desulfoluna spongiiphila]
MEAEILDRPPLSGDFEEHNFSMSGNTLWVKFLDEDYLEWVGVFSQSGWSPFNTVFRIPNEKKFLVVAGGQGYFVDPNKREIISRTEWDGINNILYNDETGFLVATDGLCLALFKGPKLKWSGERVSADGISFTGQSGPIIKGVLNDLTDEGCKFTFNAITREFKAAWILSENWG